MWPAPRASPSAAHTAQVLARRVAELESLQAQQQQEYLETTRSVEQLRESMRELKREFAEKEFGDGDAVDDGVGTASADGTASTRRSRTRRRLHEQFSMADFTLITA